MRKIKFRGIPENRDKFVYGDLVMAHSMKGDCIAIKDTIYHINDGKINLIPEVVSPKTVGQYTGKKDRNGLEIYEGDILEHDIPPISGHIEVIFQLGSWWAYCADAKTSSTWLHSLNSNDLTVIGNIHQNRELLE